MNADGATHYCGVKMLLEKRDQDSVPAVCQHGSSGLY